jgi:energy-coupling factor transporter transmembrane protein EcfT
MPDPDLFFKYEYGETKDLLKTFLTLLSGVLVFSLAFAEKIVNFSQSTLKTRALLIFAWTCFVLSIIMCGLSLCAISAAAGIVIYGEIPLAGFDWDSLALASWALVIAAGITFVMGLCLLILAAATSMRRRAQEACEASHRVDPPGSDGGQQH